MSIGTSARAACPIPVSEARLLTTLEAAATAWSDLDVDGFRDRLGDAHAQLGCVDQVVNPSTAATVHRMVGLAAFADRDTAAASKAFAAARSAAPGTRFSTALVPVGHPIDALYEAVPPMEEGLQELPATGAGWVDGVAATSRSATLPAVVQLGDPSGTLMWSGWLNASAPPPPVPLATPTASMSKTPNPTRYSTPLLLAAGTTAVGSIVLYAIAASSARQHADPTTPYTELEPLRSRTNALVLASSGTAAAALGLGTVAFSRRGS